MPARSNEFQRMIRAIETQLAPAGARVEESVMMPDSHDGTLREVDILITVPIGEREIRIGIETRDHKRRADLAWLEQLKTKFEFLSVDRRVAVSRKGFSKAALAKAKLWGIETMSLKSATSRNWNPALNRLSQIVLRGVHYETTTARLHVKLISGKTLDPTAFSDGALVSIWHPDGVVESVLDYINRGNRSPEFRAELEKHLPETLRGAFPMTFQLPPGTWIEDPTGQRWELGAIEASYHRVEQQINVPLNRGVYGKHAVVHAAATVGEISVEATYVEEERGEVQGGITIRIGDMIAQLGVPDVLAKKQT
jgi:hypothetical protein